MKVHNWQVEYGISTFSFEVSFVCDGHMKDLDTNQALDLLQMYLTQSVGCI